MIQLVISQKANKNYLAKLFFLKESQIKKHPNADRLSIVEVDYTPIISNNPQANTWYVYFPTESQINADFLRKTNSYRKVEMNLDPNATPGFFESNGRVKTVKLRGEYSSGYIVPLTSIEAFLDLEVEKKEAYFDMLGDVQLVKKYRKPFEEREQPQQSSKSDKKAAKLSIVEGQFQFHNSTDNLRKEMHTIYPEDIINISFKAHGCLKANQTIKMVDGSLKKIKDIEVGDIVLGFDHKADKFIPSKVTETFNNGHTKIWTRVFTDTSQTNIHLESGQYFGSETTPEHKYYVKDKGYVLAKNLEIGDELKLYYERFELTSEVIQDYIFLPVLKIETKEEAEHSSKYDIETETHNYITNNILVHNSSHVVGNLLHSKEIVPKWYQKLVGVKPRTETYYNYITSSRTVIKSDPSLKYSGYYKEDIWTHASESFKERIPKGWTIYSELIGYLPSGSWIQKNYDYGYEQGKYGIMPYRITVTNIDGEEVELSPEQIAEWSKKNDLVPMINYYTGSVYNHYVKLMNELDFSGANEVFVEFNKACANRYKDDEGYKEALDKFRSVYLHMLEKEYNEKDCPLCINKVPEEGIVLRKLKHPSKFEALKLKSKRFLLGESSEESASIEDTEAGE